MPEKGSESVWEERQARSLALEQAYVHDAYNQIATNLTNCSYKTWPHVKQFLEGLEAGSLVADVGCGNGKYLGVNSDVFNVGVDHCTPLAQAARHNRHEVMVCDSLQLPFRDESIDATLSVDVIHHFATAERRVQALRELARILRVGGRVMITVWAMEQKHRKFESQDVLIPWHQSATHNTREEAELYGGRKRTTSESQAELSGSGDFSSASRNRHSFAQSQGHCRCFSLDSSTAANPAQSLNTRNPHTCYSFVRRVLRKFSTPSAQQIPVDESSRCPAEMYSRSMDCLSSSPFGSDSSVGEQPNNNSWGQEADTDGMHIELRSLEDGEFDFLDGGGEKSWSPQLTPPIAVPNEPIRKKVRSFSDIFNLIPSFLRKRKNSLKESPSELRHSMSVTSDTHEFLVNKDSTKSGIVRSQTTATCLFQFDKHPCLEKVDEVDISLTECDDDVTSSGSNNDKVLLSTGIELTMTSLTSSDIANGNVLPNQISDDSIPRDNSVASMNEKNKFFSKAALVRQDKCDISSSDEEDSFVSCKEECAFENDDSVDLPPTDSYPEVTATNIVQKERRHLTSSKTLPPLCDYYDSSLWFDKPVQAASYYSMPELRNLDNCDPEFSECKFASLYRKRILRPRCRSKNAMTTSAMETKENPIIPCIINPEEILSTESNHSSVPMSSDKEADVHSPSPRNGFVKRSVSADTNMERASTPPPSQEGRRFSASEAQGIKPTGFKVYLMPGSAIRGDSLRSETSVDSEESVVTVVPITSTRLVQQPSTESEDSVENNTDSISSTKTNTTIQNPSSPSQNSLSPLNDFSSCPLDERDAAKESSENVFRFDESSRPSNLISAFTTLHYDELSKSTPTLVRDSMADEDLFDEEDICVSSEEFSTIDHNSPLDDKCSEDGEINNMKLSSSPTSLTLKEISRTSIGSDSGLSESNSTERQDSGDKNSDTQSNDDWCNTIISVAAQNVSNAQEPDIITEVGKTEILKSHHDTTSSEINNQKCLMSKSFHEENERCPNNREDCLEETRGSNRARLITERSKSFPVSLSIGGNDDILNSNKDRTFSERSAKTRRRRKYSDVFQETVAQEYIVKSQSQSGFRRNIIRVSLEENTVELFLSDDEEHPSETDSFAAVQNKDGLNSEYYKTTPEGLVQIHDDLGWDKSNNNISEIPNCSPTDIVTSICPSSDSVKAPEDRKEYDSKSAVEYEAELMETSVSSINENNFGKLEIFPVNGITPSSDPVDGNLSQTSDTDQEYVGTNQNSCLCHSSSQESLEDRGHGGALTLHRYYHVFRKGELESLIERYVENLHIISSYYDDSNWCVIAEKVQVWTI